MLSEGRGYDPNDKDDDLDWFKAERLVSDAMSMYGDLPVSFRPDGGRKKNKLYELKSRLEKGERTRRLYQEIMDLTGN